MTDHVHSCGLPRRALLGASAASLPLLLLAPRALARRFGSRADGDTILVLLRLGGGNDGLNTVIPCDDDGYHRARPSLRVDKAQALPFVDGLWLHPSLKGLQQLAGDGSVAVIENVGYPKPDRSHFRSMDIWHSASFEDPARRGFLAPLLDAPRDAASVEPAIGVVADQLPLALVGTRHAAPVLTSLEDFRLSDRDLCVGAEARRDVASPSLEHLLAAHSAALDLESRLRSVAGGAGGAVAERGLPKSALGKSLSTVLGLMAAGVRPRVFYVAHDGFDTHTRQQDAHAALLADLGDCLLAFSRALPSAIDPSKVLVLTFSEFGRRVAENGSRGTDHGASLPMFAVSTALEPGLVGRLPDLANLEDGDVAFDIDFRRVYATVLERWLGIESTPFLGERFELLPFLPRTRRWI